MFTSLTGRPIRAALMLAALCACALSFSATASAKHHETERLVVRGEGTVADHRAAPPAACCRRRQPPRHDRRRLHRHGRARASPATFPNGEGGVCAPIRGRIVLGAGTPDRLTLAVAGDSCQDGAGPPPLSSFTGLARLGRRQARHRQVRPRPRLRHRELRRGRRRPRAHDAHRPHRALTPATGGATALASRPRMPPTDHHALQAEAVALLQDLIRIDTSNPPGNETAAAELLRDYLVRHGIECELVARVPGRANLVARIHGSGGGPSLALTGHTDVVPADARDWQRPPFAARDRRRRLPLGPRRGRHEEPHGDERRRARHARPRGVPPARRPRADRPGRRGGRQRGRRDAVARRGAPRPARRLRRRRGRRGADPAGRAAASRSPSAWRRRPACRCSSPRSGEAGHASAPYLAANAVPRLATLIGRIAAHRPERTLLPVVAPHARAARRRPRRRPRRARSRTSPPRAPLLGDDLPALLVDDVRADPPAGLRPPATSCPRARRSTSTRGCSPARRAPTSSASCTPRWATTSPTSSRTPSRSAAARSPRIDSPLYDGVRRRSWREHDPEAVLLPAINTGFVDSYFMRSGWGTDCIGFWPMRTTPLEVVQPASTTATSASTSTTSATRRASCCTPRAPSSAELRLARGP